MKTYTTTGQLEQCDDWHRFMRASHWLSGWSYRDSIPASRASGAVTDYQMLVKVYYAGGTDGTESVEGITAAKKYAAGKCKTDFSDVRFAPADGYTILSYWLEIKVDS